MTAASVAAALVAASHPEHIALPIIVLVIGAIVFAVVRVRRKREAGEAAQGDRLDQPARIGEGEGAQQERREGRAGGQ